MTDISQSSLDETIEFSVAGRRCAMSGVEVLTKARQTMRGGLPPEAQTYLAWAVAVDGQLVGLKWLSQQSSWLDPHPGRWRISTEAEREKMSAHQSLAGEAHLRTVRRVLDGQLDRQPSDAELAEWLRF